MKIIDYLLEKIDKNKEVFFEIKAFPGSKEESVKEGKQRMLSVRVNASPEDGKANKEIIKLLAKTLNLRKYQVSIISGLKSKIKKIKITR
ncbi:MAG: DUF167 domain-containing protein [Patescibacteria group bacterium]|jgi:uncharacterized protein (TIGR00251 family)|nr:DUF167 domain-containing protein [Patescibacteria group bacterium]